MYDFDFDEFKQRNHAKYCEILEGEFMLYTGLMDKNGKEIYEGDIVRFNGFKKDRIELIEWENICKHTSFGGGTHNAVIIGNKYENPELLPIPPTKISDSH